MVPAKAYCAIEEPTNSKAFRRAFVYVPCTIGDLAIVCSLVDLWLCLSVFSCIVACFVCCLCLSTSLFLCLLQALSFLFCVVSNTPSLSRCLILCVYLYPCCCLSSVSLSFPFCIFLSPSVSSCFQFSLRCHVLLLVSSSAASFFRISAPERRTGQAPTPAS